MFLNVFSRNPGVVRLRGFCLLLLSGKNENAHSSAGFYFSQKCKSIEINPIGSVGMANESIH